MAQASQFRFLGPINRCYTTNRMSVPIEFAALQIAKLRLPIGVKLEGRLRIPSAILGGGGLEI